MDDALGHYMMRDSEEVQADVFQSRAMDAARWDAPRGARAPMPPSCFALCRPVSGPPPGLCPQGSRKVLFRVEG